MQASKRVRLVRTGKAHRKGEFYVTQAVNTLAVRPGQFIDEDRVDKLIVLDRVTVKIDDPQRTRVRLWKRKRKD